MQFHTPLTAGTFIKRYKRFFADIDLNGETVVAHIANTGSMKTCMGENWNALVSFHDNPNRKLKYSLEMLNNGKTWIGVNTSVTNSLAIEAIKNGTIKELQGYNNIKPEAKIGLSRIDILLSNSEDDQCYVEVKNVTLLDEEGHCTFPDAVTERGQKHLEELMDLKSKGIRTVMLFIVQRQDCNYFNRKQNIDSKYYELLKKAESSGVEILCYQCELNQNEIYVQKKLDLIN